MSPTPPFPDDLTETPSDGVVPLVDRFGRIHRSVRISVTDRCNIRCFYCMPAEGAVFSDRKDLLTFEEITRLSEILISRCGITDIRITGGEPLVRRDLHVLVQKIASIDGLQDLSLTTNGILLSDQAEILRNAGLQRLNISLDTLDKETYQQITRRDGFDKTIEGIDVAIRVGFDSIKLNALAIAGITEHELVRLVRFASDRGVTIRFIEFMPLDSDQSWAAAKVLSGDRMLEILAAEFGEFNPVQRADASQPAEEFQFGDTTVGIIRSVTQPFCGACDRIRMTADGAIRNCLFASDETPLRERMRNGASDQEIIDAIEDSVLEKKEAHGISDPTFQAPARKMYSIGG